MKNNLFFLAVLGGMLISCTNDKECTVMACPPSTECVGGECTGWCHTNPCENGGVCHDNGECACPAYFEGRSCDLTVSAKFIGQYLTSNSSCSPDSNEIEIFERAMPGEISIQGLAYEPY